LHARCISQQEQAAASWGFDQKAHPIVKSPRNTQYKNALHLHCIVPTYSLAHLFFPRITNWDLFSESIFCQSLVVTLRRHGNQKKAFSYEAAPTEETETKKEEQAPFGKKTT
jgi:hypothetical protein